MSISTNEARHLPRCRASVFSAMYVLCLITSIQFTAPDPTFAEGTASPTAANDAPNPALREKQRKVFAGLAAVAGIVIVGIGLGAFIIVWAGRLRRINREPLPPASLQNELWFLRAPKPPVSDVGPDQGGGQPEK